VKSIAVTGGAGFVGTNLVKSLSRDGFEVSIIDDFSTGLRTNVIDLDCKVIETSVTNQDSLYAALRGIDFIFHLAARGSVPRSIKNPSATFEVNSRGTFNVISYAKEHGIPLLFSSSSSVYGTNQSLPKNEHMWTAPMTPYAASKLYGEALVQSYGLSYKLPVFTYRFFNIFGPWQRPDHDYAAVIPKWIWKAMKGEVIEIFGDGEQTRDFTYVDSVISALKLVMQNKITSPHPVNLAFGKKISLNETIRQLVKYFPDLRVKYCPERPGDVRDSQNDPQVLFQTVPNIQVTQFEDGLKKTIEWLSQYGHAIAGKPNPKV
jgi:UDP-glucose 4-epimerase